MTCEEFENLLQEVLDRRETPSADPFLAPHAKACSACQRKVTLYETLFDGLELVETPALGSDFSRQASRAAKARRSWSWKTTAGVCLAVAASLLLVVTLANRGNRSDTPQSPNSLAGNDSDPKPAAEQPERRPRRKVPEGLAEGNPGRLQPKQLPATLPEPAEELAAVNPELGEIFTGIRTASENVHVPGMGPLTSSLSAGFGAIRQTLPGGKTEPPEPTKPQALRMIVQGTHWV